MSDDLDFGQTIRGFVDGQKVFGRYTLRRILGRGGMGVVWLAHDEKLEEDIALKFLPEMVRLDDAGIQDLKRETRKSLALTHANIVRIRDFVEDTNSAAIAMEYVDGPTLSASRIQQPGDVFEPEQLGGWLRQLVSALTYAHEEARVVHRDLKPANLMVNSRGQLKVADFGISSSVTDSVSRMSMKQGSSGSPPYMSPQQVMGEPPQPADDIYSVGATIYELLTGKPPFHRGNIYAQIKETVPLAMSEKREELGVSGHPKIPALWEEVVARCLAKDPAQRPKSARQMLDWLEGREAVPGWEEPKVVPPGPIAQAKNRKSKIPAFLIIGLLVLLAVGGSAGWWYGIEQPRREAARKEAAAAIDAQHKAEAQRHKEEADAKTKAEEAARQQLAGEAEKKRIEDEAKAKEHALVVEENRKAAQVEVAAEAERHRLADEAKTKADEAENQRNFPANASRDQPFENSLGMKFAPLPGTSTYFSIWETRVSDYLVFVRDTGRPWEKAPFTQTPEHPAVRISYRDAMAFCKWLTERETRSGKLPSGWEYRLPKDLEWSRAAGLDNEPDGTPASRSGAIWDAYPWGSKWPPPKGSGNYDPSLKTDTFPFTSPVGSFAPNRYGLFDLGGNVYEWILEPYDESETKGCVRGASWADGEQESLITSNRFPSDWTSAYKSYGFRCVLGLRNVR